MERKTIGSFICVLRKANGLTQRELAEKLGISDKAVSRWERDETAPDLSLIPAIAEIFRVTSDELLRGERAGEKDVSPEKQAEKTEKQIKNLLKNVRTRFFTKTLICMLIATIGLLAAMICNCVFFRKDLGFIVALIFLATSLILGIIFSHLSYTSIDDDEITSEDLPQTRKYIIKNTFKLIRFITCVLAFCLPLFSEGLSVGNIFVRTDEWILYGTMFLLCALLLCFFASIALDRIAESKGIYSAEEVEKAKRSKKKRIFLAPALSLSKVFVPVILFTIIAHLVCLSIFNVDFFLDKKGTKWHSVDDFIKFMETPTESAKEDVFYPTRDLYNNYDEYVCSYTLLNLSVYKIETSDTPDNLPITTYSFDEYFEAYNRATGINACFAIAYVVEGVTLAVLYTVKAVKAYKKETEL